MYTNHCIFTIHTHCQAVLTLNSTEGLVSSLDTILSDLNIRLDSLQSQIEQNILDLVTARNLTAIAEGVANETEVVNSLQVHLFLHKFYPMYLFRN